MAEADARHGGTVTGSEDGGQARPIAHDDIMRRLLEYQRQLREGVPPAEAARAVAESDPAARGTGSVGQDMTGTTEEVVVDLTQAEAELERRPDAEPIDVETQEPAGASDARAEEATAGGEGADRATIAAAAPPGAGAAQATRPTEAASGGSVWATPVPDPGLAERVARLERTLEEIAGQVSDLRQRFQDMAVAADERLADLERVLSRARER